MKASRIVQDLSWLIEEQGDRDVWYMSLKNKGANNESLFLEEVSYTHASVIVINGKEEPHPIEPFTLVGREGGNFLEEKLLKLNWLGRLLKRFIITQ